MLMVHGMAAIEAWADNMDILAVLDTAWVDKAG